MESITLPNSIKRIEAYAFYMHGWDNTITSVYITDLKAWCNIVFAGIESNPIAYGGHLILNGEEIKELVIPDGVSSINESAFYAYNNLTSVTIPSCVTSIGKYSFRYCSQISSLIISDGVEIIGYSAFEGCRRLSSITIPSSVTAIGDYAFSECSNLTNVTIEKTTPISITSSVFSNRNNATLYVPIGYKAAYEAANYWKEFKEIVEPSPIINFADVNVKALCVANWDTDGDGELNEAEAAAVTNLRYIFKENRNITSFNELRYFTGLTSINDEAFYYCTKLASIVIPINVTSIGRSAFFDCEALASLTIPSSVTNIDVGAFLDCGYGLNSIIVESGNTVYDSRDNCNAIIETKTNKLLWGCNNTVIPNSVTSIGNSAFSHCLLMESISIPDGVTSIGNWAFYNCQKLSSVNIPDLVTTIGEDAFWLCDALASVTIGKSVASIGSCAFQDCDNLTSVTVRMLSPVSITEKVFTNHTNATLYVPTGSKAAYEAADYWKEFKDIKEFPNGKCGTPVITYENGKFKFSSSTEGASFKSTFAYNATSTEMDGNEVAIPSTITFHVSVYATKDGYENSDIATKDIEVNMNSGKIGDMNKDGKVTVTDALMILDMILEDEE